MQTDTSPGQPFVVTGQPAASRHPGEAALNHPPEGRSTKPRLTFASWDHLERAPVRAPAAVIDVEAFGKSSCPKAGNDCRSFNNSL